VYPCYLKYNIKNFYLFNKNNQSKFNFLVIKKEELKTLKAKHWSQSALISPTCFTSFITGGELEQIFGNIHPTFANLKKLA